ncbi:MAG: zeta toxin family protein [Bacteroidetes bacterium]|nr:zeta toxin family protein [Bacteroidota bacterium]
MPDLTVIAGCNGSGKSTYASTFLPEGVTSFDYDKLYLGTYRGLPDSELRVKFAKDHTTNYFEDSIKNAIERRLHFCYETNFDSYPLFWPQAFKDSGYKINLIFFCLANIELAQHRVQVRAEFKGHFVNNKTIDYKWKAGYKNLNLHYRFFDNLLIVDNSNLRCFLKTFFKLKR